MRNWTNVLGFLFLAWFWVPLSQATLLLVSTDVTSTISFSNLSDFSGAQVHVNHSVTQTANAAGDSGAMTFNFLGGPPFNVTVTGDSHIAISALSVSPTQATFTRTSTDGLTGKFELDFYRNANPGTNFSTSVIGGANVLEYIHNPNWTLVPGSPFTFEIVMPGDWSVAGLTS